MITISRFIFVKPSIMCVWGKGLYARPFAKCRDDHAANIVCKFTFNSKNTAHAIGEQWMPWILQHMSSIAADMIGLTNPHTLASKSPTTPRPMSRERQSEVIGHPDIRRKRFVWLVETMQWPFPLHHTTQAAVMSIHSCYHNCHIKKMSRQFISHP